MIVGGWGGGGLLHGGTALRATTARAQPASVPLKNSLYMFLWHTCTLCDEHVAWPWVADTYSICLIYTVLCMCTEMFTVVMVL